MIKAEMIFKVVSPKTGDEVFVEIIEPVEGAKRPSPDAVYGKTYGN